MPKPLKILYMSAELAPLVATGGLADVAAALPRALHAQGHDVRLVIPCYDRVPPEHRGEHVCMCVVRLGWKVVHGAVRRGVVPGTEIPLYLIEHDGYYFRGDPYGSGAHEYPDNAERFCFYGLAALDGLPQTRWRPDIIHCHDWHAAPVPAFLKTRSLRDPTWSNLPTLFTIHNLNYQGRYPADKLDQTGLDPALFHPGCLEYYGDLNLMKAGIVFASKLNTVSPRYAEEIQTVEYGAGLHGLLEQRAADLSGILNGVDYSVWNPAADPYIAAHYTAGDLEGKAECKADLQRRLGLPERPDAPLIGMVTRVSWQKGLDVFLAALDRFMGHDVQVVLLGSGDPYYETQLHAAAWRHGEKMRAEIRFDIGLAHQIEAASDFFLMPSRYEPCGLSQMYSLAYGAVPIVRQTGGLADTVRDASRARLRRGKPTGIVFEPCTPEGLCEAVDRAVELYADQKAYRRVQDAGMHEDFSWARAAKAYAQLYRKAMAQP